MKDVYVVSIARTPIGSFGGAMAGQTAVQLGAVAVREVIARIGLDARRVQEIYIGNVIGAGLGQAPATQIAAAAGLGFDIPCTLVNKVCASGMKAIMLGAQSILLGQNDIVVAGGTESMSNIPYYLPKARYGYKYGNGEILDGLAHDGLTDAYQHCAMGVCADQTAKEMNLTREQQDAFAIQSYKRAAAAWSAGKFAEEVVAVEFKGRKGEVIRVAEDEEYKNVNFDKIPGLKAAFTKDGTVTAANASSINDGAAAVVLMSGDTMRELGLKPIARIAGFADAAREPMWFTTAPSLAIPKALKHAGIDHKQVDFYEINEAFSAVALANAANLEIRQDQLNVNGGAVALGHPLGASGARIVVTLTQVLRQNKGKIGVAGICNGGGGASAIVLESC